MSYAPKVVVRFGIASSLRRALPGLPFRKWTPPPPHPIMTSLGLDWVRNHSRCIFGCGCHRLGIHSTGIAAWGNDGSVSRGTQILLAMSLLVERLILFLPFFQNRRVMHTARVQVRYCTVHTQRKKEKVVKFGNEGMEGLSQLLFLFSFYPSLALGLTLGPRSGSQRRSEVNRPCLCEFAQILTASYHTVWSIG